MTNGNLTISNLSTTKVVACFALCAALALATTRPAGALSNGLQVQPAKTRIGIAKVILKIDALNLAGDDLVGEYKIRIPLAPFMDDHGSIRFNLDRPLHEAVLPGSTILGTASSLEDGRVHPVECTFLQGERVNIAVTTNDRILRFQAPFSLNL